MSRPTVVAKVLDYQAKQIIYNVYTFYKNRKKDYSSSEFKEDVNLTAIVSEATGVSKTTVTRIIREGNQIKMNNSGDPVQFKEQCKIKQVRKKRIAVDECLEGVIRRKVIQFYSVKKQVPSVRKLNAILKEEKLLNCSNEYLRQLLHRLGFTNVDRNALGVITERRELVKQRLNYLQTIKEYRAQGRSIFFLNDTNRWDKHQHEQCELNEMPDIVAVGISGFTDGSLIMFKFKSTIHCERDENIEFFETFEWIKDKFMPNLPPSSVIIMNIPNKKPTEKPLPNATRIAMQDWLTENQFPFTDTETKNELFKRICRATDQKKLYRIDNVLTENGHHVLYLPEKYFELNPILIVWEKLKSKVNVNSPKELFSNYSKANWQKCLDRVKDAENEYYGHDIKYDEVVKDMMAVKPEPEENDEDNGKSDMDDMDCDSS